MNTKGDTCKRIRDNRKILDRKKMYMADGRERDGERTHLYVRRVCSFFYSFGDTVCAVTH